MQHFYLISEISFSFAKIILFDATNKVYETIHPMNQLILGDNLQIIKLKVNGKAERQYKNQFLVAE